jgi:predicted small lipoprotein YifL
MIRRLFRALLVLATSTLVVCGVKGPPRPPAPETADAGVPDGGAR